jgi:type I site-specific restriction-modification system R (restriction) subunit
LGQSGPSVGRKIRTSIFPPVGLVNGLPLVAIQFKKPGVPARAAFDGN